MPTDQTVEITQPEEASRSLARVLQQSEHVKGIVEESAAELTSVNRDFKQELAEGGTLQGLKKTLDKTEAVETKVQDASEKLSVVNEALETEVRDRNMLEHQFAAAREQEQAARYAAFHDVLTGLPNRALFNDRLGQGLAQASRHSRNLSVMFIDLDGFKHINDTHGHDAGDRVLRGIAARLKEYTRDDDTVSRYGGDEFLYVLMEVGDRKTVASIAEKILGAIRLPCTVRVGDDHISLSVGASIGIAMFPNDGTTAGALVASADKAMYQAKKTRSSFSFAT